VNRKTLRNAMAPGIGVATAALLVLAAGCAKLDPIQAPQPVTGSADFSSYVAIGTSISMGTQSGGVVEDAQVNSFPALLAGAAGANGGTFTQPLLATPGVPPVLEVTGFTSTGFPILTPRPGTPPAGPSTPRPADGYDNLGVYGAVVANVLTKTSGGYFDLVLQGQGTVIRQAVAQKPTFVTVELGANDAMTSLLLGRIIALPTRGEFEALYTQVLDSLATVSPVPKMALVNVPDVVEIPYATTVPIDVTGPYGPGGVQVTIRLRDAAGPLPDGSLILLPAAPYVAQGMGFPSPAPPLPDTLVIRPDEKATIHQAVLDYNEVIAGLAHARDAALVDAYGIFKQAGVDGILIGGVRYRTSFVSGGLFSFDGVHPSTVAHGVIANATIDAINAKFGARIPPVDVNRLMLTGARPAADRSTLLDAATWREVDPHVLEAGRRGLLGESPW
jgi:lysophospholipase L1-like esterase